MTGRSHGKGRQPHLSKRQLWALGGAAIHAAICTSGGAELEADAGAVADMRRQADALLARCELTPTELKNLGLRMLSEAQLC